MLTSSATQGAPAAGDEVDVAVGTLAPFQETRIQFRLKVAQPLPAGVAAIVARGTVTSDQLDPVVTDDPQTVALGDGTSLPIGGVGGDPEFPGPTAGDVQPAEGAMVTQPTHVTATLTPPAGETVTSWTVDYRAADDQTTTVIGTGTGTNVDAVLDPTKMPNGAYVVTVRATSSNGGVSATETTVVVDGQMKFGHYRTTVTDMTVGVGGLPIQVNRTYDSFDKAVGDFGHGWSVDLGDFRVSTNGPLGQGGNRLGRIQADGAGHDRSVGDEEVPVPERFAAVIDDTGRRVRRHAAAAERVRGDQALEQRPDVRRQRTPATGLREVAVHVEDRVDRRLEAAELRVRRIQERKVATVHDWVSVIWFEGDDEPRTRQHDSTGKAAGKGTLFGVVIRRESSSRALILPSLLATYPRAYMRRPASTISARSCSSTRVLILVETSYGTPRSRNSASSIRTV